MVRDPVSARVEPLLEQDPEIACWWGAPLECVGALAHARRRDRLSAADFQKARAVLDHLRETAVEVQPTAAVRDRALRILPVHALRAGAAFELAAAFIWCRERTHEVEFVALDEPLRLAAALEGFRVLPYADEVHEPQEEESDR
ncbi:MAG TPA: hypothetical protein VGX68_14845 [Thermoanaerobaculia bacterium]|jgi:hypothetical protein|nr:hypothetical protein [Thermoanaerobaculia bacterium]